MRTCRASCAERPGRNPKLHGKKSASKTGSSTIFTAACTIRSRTAEIASGLRSVLPGLGISTFRAGSGRHVPARNSAASSPRSRSHPVLLDVSQGGLVNARRAVVAAHRDPRPPQDVFAVDLVPQRMEPSSRIGLGRPVEHMLQCADPVASDSRQGGPSRISGTHRSGPPSLRVNEAAALPSPQVVLSCRSDRYYGRLRLPPGTPPASRLLTGYRTRPSASPRARSDRGGPPQFPPPPSERSAPSTPDSPSRLRFQDLHRFHGLHRDYRGSALSHSLTTRQASLDATDRSVAPLLLKGFRRWAPTRPVSRPDRQPATGPPGSYPDRTFTGRRRRASDQVMIAGQPPPDALGARNFGLDHAGRSTRLTASK